MNDSNLEQETNAGERILVVGGGGARGAWSGGFAKYLVSQHGRPYRYVIGTSTGSLIAPLVVLNDFRKLQDAYTSVEQSSIFNVNPFKKNGDLKPFNALWRVITRKQTFGESRNLKNLIGQFVKPEMYNEIVNASHPRQITVCYINFKTGKVGYARSGTDMTYDQMVNWIWASANEPLFMTFVEEPELKGGYYVDGGVRQNVPVTAALADAKKLGIQHIDVIVSKPRDPIIDKDFRPSGLLHNLLRVIELWETQVRNDNIFIAKLLDEENKTTTPEPGLHEIVDQKPTIQLSFHYIPPELYKNNFKELIFNKKQMTELWRLGEKGEQDGSPVTVRLSHKSAEKYTTRII